MDVPWLTLVIVAPLVGVPVLFAWREITDGAARWVALGASLLAFAVSVGMLMNFDTGEPGFWPMERFFNQLVDKEAVPA